LDPFSSSIPDNPPLEGALPGIDIGKAFVKVPLISFFRIFLQTKTLYPSGGPAVDSAFFRNAFEELSSPMAMATPSGQLIEANRAYCQFLGYSRSELLAKSVFEITHPADLERARTFFQEVAEGKREEFCYEKRYFRKDGQEVWALVTASWRRKSRSASPFCIAVIQDITQKKLTELALKEKEEVYRSLVENIDLGIALIDEDHRVLHLNRSLARMYQKEALVLPGEKCYRIFGNQEDICPYCPGTRAMKEGGVHFVETELMRNDGSRFLANLRAMPVFDADGQVRKFIQVVEDVTGKRAIESELKLSQDRINYLAHHDPLTDLPNRTLLYDRLKQAVDRAQRHQEGLAVIIFNLDPFKKINEGFGFDVSNQVLREVGKRLKARVRKIDSLCFMGGDNFAMVLEKAGTLQRSAIVAGKILTALKARPFSVAGHELHITASIGISHYPDDGEEVEALFRAAESARLQARKHGGDGYQYYQPAMERKSKDLLELQGQLHRALEQDQLTAFYQAQVNPATGRVIGLEALARWRHPEKGLVSPADFIPLAEETGLIVPLGRRILEVACSQAQQWQAAGLLNFRVAINVSPLQIARGHLEQTVRDVLEKTGLPPNRLEIEITETALVNEPEKALQTLTALKNMGLSVALDDFGTGYSALGYLKTYPIDRIKISQDFIRNVQHNARDAAIVESIFALGKKLNMDVIAEGVETAGHLNCLLGLGCKVMQGYYFARPLDAVTMTRYLAEWNGPHGVCPLGV
jgi:diguanylate cyclase (GGDEF)-like protein/PAS domain S-box-containing protein